MKVQTKYFLSLLSAHQDPNLLCVPACSFGSVVKANYALQYISYTNTPTYTEWTLYRLAKKKTSLKRLLFLDSVIYVQNTRGRTAFFCHNLVIIIVIKSV